MKHSLSVFLCGVQEIPFLQLLFIGKVDHGYNFTSIPLFRKKHVSNQSSETCSLNLTCQWGLLLQGMMLDLIRYKKSSPSTMIAQEEGASQASTVRRRLEVLKEACEGNSSLLAEVEKLRSKFSQLWRWLDLIILSRGSISIEHCPLEAWITRRGLWRKCVSLGWSGNANFKVSPTPEATWPDHVFCTVHDGFSHLFKLSQVGLGRTRKTCGPCNFWWNGNEKNTNCKWKYESSVLFFFLPLWKMFTAFLVLDLDQLDIPFREAI